VSTTDTHADDAAWRIESARLIAGLARIVRDVGLARRIGETRSSPRSKNGPKRRPENRAWLMATAKHARSTFSRANFSNESTRVGRELKSQQEAAWRNLNLEQGDIETTSFGWSLFRAIRFFRRMRVLRDASSPRPASPQRIAAPISCRSRPSRNASCAQNARFSDAKVHLKFRLRRTRAARLSSVIEVIYLIFQRRLFRDGRQR